MPVSRKHRRIGRSAANEIEHCCAPFGNQVNSLNREIALRQLKTATSKAQPRMEDGASFFVLKNRMRNQIRGKAMVLDNISDTKEEISLAGSGLFPIDDLLGEFTSEALNANIAENEEDPEADINALDNAKRSISLIDFAIKTVKDQLNELGGIPAKFTSLQNILSTSMATEESVANRFGNADLAREQIEIAKLRLFNQLATARTASANAAPLQLFGALMS